MLTGTFTSQKGNNKFPMPLKISLSPKNVTEIPYLNHKAFIHYMTKQVRYDVCL